VSELGRDTPSYHCCFSPIAGVIRQLFIQNITMTNMLNNQQRAKNVQLIFWVMLGITALGIMSDVMQFNLLSQENYGDEAAQLNDTRQSVVGILQIAVFITAVVLFILWFRRAYANLHRIGAQNLRFTEGWAAGAWFVPFLNLVRPYQIMVEIWEETQRNTPSKEQVEAPSIVGWWWGAYLISGFIDRISFRMTLRAETIEELSNSTMMSIFGQIAGIPALLLVLFMAKKASGFEAELFNARHEMSIDDHLIGNNDGQL